MKTATTMLFLLLFALACSSDRGDPLGPDGGSLSPGANRANLAVTTGNQYEALQALFEQLYSSYKKAISVASAGGTGEKVRVLGDFNGIVIASTVNRDSTGGSSVFFSDLDVEYTGYYSETGMLFINGTLKLFGQWSTPGGNVRLDRFDLRGTVEVSGDFAGTFQFIGFRMALDDSGKPLDLPGAARGEPTYSLPRYGSVKIASEGVNPIIFNPYDFDWVAPDE